MRISECGAELGSETEVVCEVDGVAQDRR
jgi:hypothetical protein